MERNWIEVFQKFHENPELGFEETLTTKRIREILTEEQIEILNLPLDTGLIAVIRGKNPGKNIAYRADIDALPLQEQTGLSYESKKPEIMHACGHDFHTTVALAVASHLKKREEEINGNIYFIFQPGEEVANGAKKVIETGALKEISEYYAVHADPGLPVGTFGVKEGPVMAAVDRFKVTVTGKGTHAATPHLGNSPISPIIQMVLALQNIVPGRISALHPAVLTIAQISAGTSWNIIPEEGDFQGTVRSTDAKDRELIKKQVLKTIQTVSELYDVETDIKWHTGPAPVVNSKELVKRSEVAFQKTKADIRHIETAMTSDDFSDYFAENNAKGLFLRAGTGEGYPLHHPKFQVDTAAIEKTITLVEHILLNALD